MAPNQSQRPQFYEGQYLGAEDLQALTEYDRSMDARHALGAHTWGIASGMQLIDRDIPGGVDVYLTPGHAWDGFGRPIAVLSPYKLSTELFKSIAYDATIDEPKGRLIKIWLRYEEIKARRPAPGFEPCNGDPFSRVQEIFRIEIGERTPSQRQTNLSAGGVASPAQNIHAKLGMSPTVLYDESVPFQFFPSEGDPARSLIPIGAVRWKPNANPLLPGAFVKREPDDLIHSRRVRWSIGVVAETIRPVEDVVRIRGRGQDPAPKRWSNDIAWIEGDLRIDGKLNLCDSGVGSFKWQVDGTTPSLTIGEANATKPEDPAVPRVTVKAGGNVGIGTATPGHKLEVSGGGTAFIDLKVNGRIKTGDSGNVGGVWLDEKQTMFVGQNGTNVGFWTKGKGWDAFQVTQGGNVGIGTSAPIAPLSVLGNDQQPGTAIFTPHPAKGTFSSHVHWDPTGDWYIRSAQAAGKVIIQDTGGKVGIGTSTPALTLDVQGDLGRTNGPCTLHLWGSEIGDRGGGILSLKSGGSTVAFDGGDKVGIHTSTPQSRLHVVDDINGDAELLSSHVATIENRSSGDSADVLALKIGMSSPGAANNFVTFFGGGNIVGRIEGNSGGIAFLSGSGDFAECLPLEEKSEDISAADIVGVYSGRITKRTQQAEHVMAVSTRPLIVGCVQPREREHLYRTVAFLGQVPVKVRGLVDEGDYIVPSGLNDGIGRAVKPAEIHSCDRGTIVGRAWESSQDPGVKLIKTAVGLSSFDTDYSTLSCLQRQQCEIREMQKELALLKSCARQEGEKLP